MITMDELNEKIAAVLQHLPGDNKKSQDKKFQIWLVVKTLVHRISGKFPAFLTFGDERKTVYSREFLSRFEKVMKQEKLK